MARITYIQPDGTPRDVEVESGLSVMEGAVRNGVKGIEAECGGSCMCATCHVYVDETFLGILPPPAEDEREMLDCVADERRPNSRLSCQLKVGDDLDGLVVELPEVQS